MATGWQRSGSGLCVQNTVRERANKNHSTKDLISKKMVFWKMKVKGLERCCGGEEHWLFLQRTKLLFPAFMWWLPTICNFGSMGSNISFWLLWVSGMQVVHKYAWIQNIYKHEIKIDIFKWKQNKDISRFFFKDIINCQKMVFKNCYPGMVAHVSNSSTWETEAEELWIQSQPEVCIKCLVRQTDRQTNKHYKTFVYAWICICIYMFNAYTYIL